MTSVVTRDVIVTMTRQALKDAMKEASEAAIKQAALRKLAAQALHASMDDVAERVVKQAALDAIDKYIVDLARTVADITLRDAAIEAAEKAAVSAAKKSIAKATTEASNNFRQMMPNLPRSEIDNMAKAAGKRVEDGIRQGAFDGMSKLPNEAFEDAVIRTNGVLAGSFKRLTNALSTATTAETRLAIRNTIFLLGVLAAVGYVSYLIIDPQVKTDKINSTEYHITSIIYRSAKVAEITFEPSQLIHPADVVSITKSVSTPSIDGVVQVVKVLSPAKIQITTEKPIPTVDQSFSTREYKMGILRIETTFDTQLQTTLAKAGTTLGGGFGSFISGLGAGVGGFFQGLLSNPYTMTAFIISIIIFFGTCALIIYIILK